MESALSVKGQLGKNLEAPDKAFDPTVIVSLPNQQFGYFWLPILCTVPALHKLTE